MPIGPLIFAIIYCIIKVKVPPPPNEVITPSGVIVDNASFSNMAKSLRENPIRVVPPKPKKHK